MVRLSMRSSLRPDSARRENHYGDGCPGGEKCGKDGWCEECKENHHTCHYGDYEDGEGQFDHTSRSKQGNRNVRCKHRERDFSLALTRNKFPFLTGRRGVAVTSLHFLFDVGDAECGPQTAKVRFVPPSCSHAGHHHHHHRKDGGAKASNKTQTRKDGSHHSDSCPDTQDIPLVRAEGGMLRGSLVLPKPVELADRSTGDRGDGLIGRFWLPCSVKGVKGAWLLCGYQCREKECLYRKVIGGCCV